MNPKQARFVQEFLVDSNAAGAARRAGYSPRSARVNGPRMLSNAAVREALAAGQQAEAERLQLDRQRVLAGLMEAVATARAHGDPGAMIRAWAEIGRLMGFYAPERRAVEVTATTRRFITQRETLPDEQLLAMVAGEGSA